MRLPIRDLHCNYMPLPTAVLFEALARGSPQTLDIQLMSKTRVSFFFLRYLQQDIIILFIRPSVRDVPVSNENGRHSCFSPYPSPIILVLPASNIFTKFRRGHPCGGAKYRWGIEISRFSTNKSLYLANDTKYRHSYYRRRIGNRTQAFEWHQFQ